MKKIICFAFLLLSGIAYSQQNIKNVDAATFKKLVDGKQSVLIDLRTPGEIEKTGMIPGAIKIDFLAKDAEKNIEALDKKQSYLIYCAGGGRSSDCALLMQKQGFKNVTNLEKGFDDWKKKGYDVAKN